MRAFVFLCKLDLTLSKHGPRAAAALASLAPAGPIHLANNRSSLPLHSNRDASYQQLPQASSPNQSRAGASERLERERQRQRDARYQQLLQSSSPNQSRRRGERLGGREKGVNVRR